MNELKPSSTREYIYITVERVSTTCVYQIKKTRCSRLTIESAAEASNTGARTLEIITEFSSPTNEEVLNCIAQYSSKTPYLIVSGGLLAAEDRKMEDFEEA